MTQSPIFGLGYVRVRRADLEEWRRFAEQVVGLMTTEGGDDRLLLRMDDWVARFVVDGVGEGPGHAGTGDAWGSTDARVSDVAIGWECRGEDAWDSARRAVENAGVITVDGSGPTPWCRDWFSFTDPSGFRCELFYGGRRDPATQYVSPLGVRFVTGDQGMGHVTLFADEIAKSVEFYTKALGFQVREGKLTGDEMLRAIFLSPSVREHSLALLATTDTSRVGHVLMEVDDLDAVGRAMDRCLDGLAPMTVSIGRHWNDQMVSFYLRTPSGFDVEYGFGGKRAISEEWSRGEQGGSGLTSTWGHRRVLPDGRLGLQLGR
jgi:3,4-dihydroxy-9,10-secoandrosta-1,3,5(10)-triene-9,17-dione 4,5-dioxygenase